MIFDPNALAETDDHGGKMAICGGKKALCTTS
jgi:hypothetical protein